MTYRRGRLHREAQAGQVWAAATSKVSKAWMYQKNGHSRTICWKVRILHGVPSQGLHGVTLLVNTEGASSEEEGKEQKLKTKQLLFFSFLDSLTSWGGRHIIKACTQVS